MDIRSYVLQVLPYAEQVSQRTGLPLDYVIAQSQLESGAGSSGIAIGNNNYFGITNPGGGFAYYPTIASGFQGFADLMLSPRYAGSYAGLSDPLAIGNAINKAGYSTTPDYGSRISSLIPGVDKVLQTLGISTGSSGSVPTQAGASGGTSSDSSGGWFSAIGDYLTRGAVLILAVVIVGVGLWMLAK